MDDNPEAPVVQTIVPKTVDIYVPPNIHAKVRSFVFRLFARDTLPTYLRVLEIFCVAFSCTVRGEILCEQNAEFSRDPARRLQ